MAHGERPRIQNSGTENGGKARRRDGHVSPSGVWTWGMGVQRSQRASAGGTEFSMSAHGLGLTLCVCVCVCVCVFSRFSHV